MGKWIKYVLGLMILAFLVHYLCRHWEQLQALFKFTPLNLFMLYAIIALGRLNISRINQHLLGALGTKVSLTELYLLQNATRLLNYLPFKFGTAFRGNYLKLLYGLSYSHYASFFIYLALLSVAVATVLGFVALVAGYGIVGRDNKILAALFLILFVTSLLLLVLPLPAPTGPGKVKSILRNFFQGRKKVSANTNLFICAGHLVISVLILSVITSIIYDSLGQSLHPAGYVIIAALGFTSSFISITPGAIGIREIITASGAMVLGVPLEVGLLAAMLNRAVELSWVFTVGGACTAWLWHKHPGTLKKTTQESS